ncbi:MAG: hypothetical protein RL736_959, partial [Pseudomonadota bacterium]
EWNEKINVISRKDIDNFYLHHVLHSLTIATTFEFQKDTTIMDLGCAETHKNDNQKARILDENLGNNYVSSVGKKHCKSQVATYNYLIGKK